MTILLLATGGTIASRPRDSDGAVTVAIKGGDLLARTPGIDASDVEVVDIAHGPSWTWDPAFQAEVAAAAGDALDSGHATGVVVTHGTDTVEETAWLTELLARRSTARGPIVFTAAMRHADDLSADGPKNLADALATAAHPDARNRGVLLCVNGELHHARWVTKTDTTAVSTFRSPTAGPLGRVVGGSPHFTLASPPPPPQPPADGPVIDGAVAVVHSHGTVDQDLIDWHLDRDIHGLVVEGTGAGNVHAALLPGIEKAIAADIPVVLASRCINGPVAPIYGGPGGGAELAAMGVIRAGDLGANRARLALVVALADNRSPVRVRAWFEELTG